MRMLLIEIRLLEEDDQYAMIKIARSPGIEQIKAETAEQVGGVINTLSSTAPNTASTVPTPISLKSNNQRAIALSYNPVFHAHTKHVDIQYHYICDKVVSGRIDLQYVPTSEMIVDRLTKTLIQAKFHIFVK